MNPKKILFITQEVTPYLPDTEIANICRKLPQGIQERGREIRIFMPRYGHVNERRNQLHEVIRLSGLNLIIDDTDHPLVIKVASIQSARMQVYFIDNEDYFHRKHIVSDDEGNEFEDNDERAIFYIRGVLETVKKLRWIPDLIHCHGWLSALAPIYLKRRYGNDPGFSRSKVVYSIYNDPFKIPLNKKLYSKMRQDGMSDRDLALIKQSTDFEAITSLAVKFADGVIQACPEISPEIADFIKTENKPFLPFQDFDGPYIDAYNDFYDYILSIKK
ncbi:MAG: glycogen/starch synthase [Tannerella sp.]|jgi:starch synthase|nr:glycogen/starch synthase [Tannerella sp.]